MSPVSDDLSDDDRFNFTPEQLARLETRWKSDVDLKLDRLDRRTVAIERLVWVAVGATTVLGATAGLAVVQLDKYSATVQAISIRQAEGIAERKAHIEALKQEMNRLREQMNGRRPRDTLP